MTVQRSHFPRSFRPCTGKKLTDEAIAEAAKLAGKGAKPLDNTDHVSMGRKKVVVVETKRAFEGLR